MPGTSVTGRFTYMTSLDSQCETGTKISPSSHLLESYVQRGQWLVRGHTAIVQKIRFLTQARGTPKPMQPLPDPELDRALLL